MSEMPSHFETVCPNCLVGLRVPLSYSGCNVLCKYCEHKFRVFGPDHLVTPSHGERDQLGERLRDLQAQLSNRDAQRDELAEQLRQRDHELATKLDELERLAALRQADAAESAELRGTLARREQEFQQEAKSCVGRSTSFTAPLSVPSRHMAMKEAGWTNSTTRPGKSLSRPGRKSECFRPG